MEAQYYMSVDGGGTKLFAVLFDKNLNLISAGKSGAVNPGFIDMQSIHSHMQEAVSQCLDGRCIEKIEKLYISMPGPVNLFEEILRRHCGVGEIIPFSEGYACIQAGLLQKGFVALSGTGSGVFYQDGAVCRHHIGGWGALFGDEGSGYDIGAKGLRAFQYAFDGRGEKTRIVDEVMAEYGIAAPYDMVNLTYRKGNNYRTVISKACLAVCRAANAGDKAAVSIMEQAGRDMAHQVATLAKRYHIDGCEDVVFSGSVWKDNPCMQKAFEAAVKELYPQYRIHKPLFEPVMGGVVNTALSLYGGLDDTLLDRLKENFCGYLYEKTQYAGVPGYGGGKHCPENAKR